MLGLLAAASSARRATWAGFASAHQPPPHEFRNRPCEPKTGLPVDFFRHPARTHAAALKKILRLSASIEGKLRRAKPSDPLVAEENPGRPVGPAGDGRSALHCHFVRGRTTLIAVLLQAATPAHDPHRGCDGVRSHFGLRPAMAGFGPKRPAPKALKPGSGVIP